VETGTSRTSWIRIVLFLVVGAGLGCLIYFSPLFFAKNDKDTTPQLKTGGTSSVFNMVDAWKAPYRKDKGVELEYDNTGSTAGVNNMIDHTYSIGFTHAPISEEQRKKAQGEVVQVPVVICAVAPVYNLKEISIKEPLNFTGEVLGKIFVGEITKWNDDAIKELNPKVKDKLPDRTIEVVHRKDSSGTTFIFAQYLHATSDNWRKKMGEPKSEYKEKDEHKWLVGVGKERSRGVAEHVRATEGTIGYVEHVWVYVNGGELQWGAVQNKDKNAFLMGKPEYMTAAAESLAAGDIKDDLSFDLTNRPGEKSYPICGSIWAVCYRDQPAANYKTVADFLEWMTHEGQKKYPETRSYAPLTKTLLERADAKLKTIKSAS
jgi:phosphate ABC transporter phosphate-binding protein